MSLLARLTAAVAAIPPEATPDRRDAAAFRAEADRRRRLALSLCDPRLYDVRQRLRLELDAFHDAFLGVWLFPDRAALEAAQAMVGARPRPGAPPPMRELRTRLAVRVGGVYTTPPHRVAEGWPPRVRVERVRDVLLPDGAKLYVAAVVPFTAAPPAG